MIREEKIMKNPKLLLTASALVIIAVASFALIPNVVEAHTRTVKVRVDKNGFSPSSIDAEAGHKINLVFRRVDKDNCGSVVSLPDRNIRRNLPVGKNVVISVTPTQSGPISFTCGTGIHRGTIVVSEG